ncbi:hypothetical protein C5S35_00375, partial [Candidatus Methanophagaceae archaeon]
PFSLKARYIDFTHEIGYDEISLFQILKISNFREINIYQMRNKKKGFHDYMYYEKCDTTFNMVIVWSAYSTII